MLETIATGLTKSFVQAQYFQHCLHNVSVSTANDLLTDEVIRINIVGIITFLVYLVVNTYQLIIGKAVLLLK